MALSQQRGQRRSRTLHRDTHVTATPMGPAGPPGISAWGFYTEGRDLAPDEPQEWQVMCPSGKTALGGGVHTGSSSRYVTSGSALPRALVEALRR